jgi:hypothetical protein
MRLGFDSADRVSNDQGVVVGATSRIPASSAIKREFRQPIDRLNPTVSARSNPNQPKQNQHARARLGHHGEFPLAEFRGSEAAAGADRLQAVSLAHLEHEVLDKRAATGESRMKMVSDVEESLMRFVLTMLVNRPDRLYWSVASTWNTTEKNSSQSCCW